jgi:hypothetical protein
VTDAVIEALADRCDGFSFAFLQELVMSAAVRWVAEPTRRTMAELLTAELDALLAQRAARPSVETEGSTSIGSAVRSTR